MKNKQWCNDDYTNTTVHILNKVQGPQAWHQLQDTLLHIQCSRYNGKEFSWWYGKLQHHPFTKRKDPAVTKNIFVIIINIIYYSYNTYIIICIYIYLGTRMNIFLCSFGRFWAPFGVWTKFLVVCPNMLYWLQWGHIDQNINHTLLKPSTKLENKGGLFELMEIHNRMNEIQHYQYHTWNSPLYLYNGQEGWACTWMHALYATNSCENRNAWPRSFFPTTIAKTAVLSQGCLFPGPRVLGMLCVCGVHETLWKDVEVRKRLETKNLSDLIVTVDGTALVKKDVDHCWLNKCVLRPFIDLMREQKNCSVPLKNNLCVEMISLVAKMLDVSDVDPLDNPTINNETVDTQVYLAITNIKKLLQTIRRPFVREHVPRDRCCLWKVILKITAKKNVHTGSR